jgi:biotin carboxyl carrier protein
MKHTVIIDGQPFDIELVRRSDDETIEAEIGGRKYTLNVQAVEPGVYWLAWNHRSIEISVSPNGDVYVASVNGGRMNVEIVDARNALRKAAQHGHAGTVELRAPMPGKIVKVLVHEGAAVEANQDLLVIEAMKMQNEVKSPKKGTVRKIGVKETAAVNAGDLLVIVE